LHYIADIIAFQAKFLPFGQLRTEFDTSQSDLRPPAFPPQSVKLQSLTHADSFYAIFYAQKKHRVSPML